MFQMNSKEFVHSTVSLPWLKNVIASGTENKMKSKNENQKNYKHKNDKNLSKMKTLFLRTQHFL